MRSQLATRNIFRVLISSVVSGLVAVAILLVAIAVDWLDVSDTTRLLTTAYMVWWPLYVLVYVVWSYRVYVRLDAEAAKAAGEVDEADESNPLARLLGASGTTDTTVSAAAVAVLVTIIVALQPEFRSEPAYILFALITVASSWVLMVFSFGQSYLRLAASDDEPSHFRFTFDDPPVFSDYLTLALTISASAAAVSAETVSRRAWRLVRVNVIVAFVFNSVIIAMLVSLVFGGLG